MDIITKICFKCGELKPLSSFYKHSQMKDGHLGKCKMCTKKDVNLNRWDNREYYKDYDRKRGCRSNNKYRKPGTSDCCRLPKQPCAVCGYTGYVEAHHEDYNKPKEVTWLCYQHHMALHGKCLF